MQELENAVQNAECLEDHLSHLRDTVSQQQKSDALNQSFGPSTNNGDTLDMQMVKSNHGDSLSQLESQPTLQPTEQDSPDI